MRSTDKSKSVDYYDKYFKYKSKYLNFKNNIWQVGSADNMTNPTNDLIIDQFNKLIKQIRAEYFNALIENDAEEMLSHSYRLKQIKKSLSTILSLDYEITSEDDVKGIPGIGKGTLNRIKEILEKGSLSELQKKYDAKKQAKINSIQELLNIYGVGEGLARRLLIEHGIRNVDEFKEAVDKGKIRVNRQIKLGLKYYKKLKTNIPRSEIKEIEKYLVKKAKEVDKDLHVLLCGSYRRGKLISSDIDVMIYHPDVKYVRHLYRLEDYGFKPYLELFVELLTKDGFLLDNLSMDKMKYMGFCKYKSNPVRRIDILFMPSHSLPAALLYFTGPARLNEEMRTRAKKRDMTLNEYGLFIVDSQGRRYPVPVNSEKDIFEELDMKYLTPEERELYN